MDNNWFSNHVIKSNNEFTSKLFREFDKQQERNRILNTRINLNTDLNTLANQLEQRLSKLEALDLK